MTFEKRYSIRKFIYYVRTMPTQLSLHINLTPHIPRSLKKGKMLVSVETMLLYNFLTDIMKDYKYADYNNTTRMHSSRMHTIRRSSHVHPSMHRAGEQGCLSMGMSAWGVSAWG